MTKRKYTSAELSSWQISESKIGVSNFVFSFEIHIISLWEESSSIKYIDIHANHKFYQVDSSQFTFSNFTFKHGDNYIIKVTSCELTWMYIFDA